MTWLPVLVTVPPAEGPVSLDEAKAQCRVTTTSEDTLIGRLINAATALVEIQTNTKLVTQTVVMRCSSFCDFARLPTGPIESITDIKYLDENGVEQTLANTVYEGQLVGIEPAIRLKMDQYWPTIRQVPDAIRVTADAGYGGEIPEPLIHLILLLVEQWYDYRSPVDEMNVNHLPNTIRALLAPYRRF